MSKTVFFIRLKFFVWKYKYWAKSSPRTDREREWGAYSYWVDYPCLLSQQQCWYNLNKNTVGKKTMMQEKTVYWRLFVSLLSIDFLLLLLLHHCQARIWGGLWVRPPLGLIRGGRPPLHLLGRKTRFSVYVLNIYVSVYCPSLSLLFSRYLK